MFWCLNTLWSHLFEPFHWPRTVFCQCVIHYDGMQTFTFCNSCVYGFRFVQLSRQSVKFMTIIFSVSCSCASCASVSLRSFRFFCQAVDRFLKQSRFYFKCYIFWPYRRVKKVKKDCKAENKLRACENAVLWCRA